MKGLWVAASAICLIVPYAAASEADTAWGALGLPAFEPQRVATTLDADLEPMLAGADAVTSPVASRGVGEVQETIESVDLSFDPGFCGGDASVDLGALDVPAAPIGLRGERVSTRLVLGPSERPASEHAMGGVIAGLLTVASVQ